MPAIGILIPPIGAGVAGQRGLGDHGRLLLEVGTKAEQAGVVADGRFCISPSEPGLGIFAWLAPVMFITAVLQLVALPVVGATIAFAIAGVAGCPTCLVGDVDRAERFLGVVVTVDRVIVDLLFALVVEGVGAIENVEQLLYGILSFPADAPQVSKQFAYQRGSLRLLALDFRRASTDAFMGGVLCTLSAWVIGFSVLVARDRASQELEPLGWPV